MELMDVYLGVDPGKNGAACIKTESFIDIRDYKSLYEANNTLSEWSKQYNIVGCFIEDVHPRPKDGKVTAAKLCRNYGRWEGLLVAHGIEVRKIDPRVWRCGLFTDIPGDTTKKKSLSLARKMFPDSDFFNREHDHDRAEAMLIAHQCEKNWHLNQKEK